MNNMTAKEFLIWLEGFANAVNTSAPTMEQWRQVLAQLEECQSIQRPGQ